MSLRNREDVDIGEAVIQFCWSVWAELGVSGWGRAHQGWAIDVEPLIIFTAAIGERDPRLRDEATDWCVRNWRLVSRVRLRNILRRSDRRDPREKLGIVCRHCERPCRNRLAWRGILP